MQTIRHVYDNAPDTISVPEEFRRRRLEVLLIVEEEGTPQSLKSLVADMPDVGDDNDFARLRDLGRQDESWGS